MPAKLARIRHVVLDMDGPLYRGGELFACTLPFLLGKGRTQPEVALGAAAEKRSG